MVPIQPDPEGGLHKVPLPDLATEIPQTLPAPLINHQTRPALPSLPHLDHHHQQQALLVPIDHYLSLVSLE